MEKWRIFVVKTLHFSNFWDFFFQLDLDFTFEKPLSVVGLGLSFNKSAQDQIWIAKCDSPFISLSYFLGSESVEIINS